MITREMLESLGVKYPEPPPGAPARTKWVPCNPPHIPRRSLTLPTHPGLERLELKRPNAAGEKIVLCVPRIR